MDALAEFGECFGEKVGPDTFVHRGPASPCVVGAERPHGRNADPHPVVGAWVENYAVKAQSPEAGLPLRPRRVSREGVDLGPRVASVLALEKGRRLDAGVDGSRLTLSTGLQMPDSADCVVGAFTFALASEGGVPRCLGPGGAQIVGALDLGAKDRVVDVSTSSDYVSGCCVKPIVIQFDD